MDVFEIKEKELENQLKSVCDDNGRELDAEKSTSILNNLGLLYKSRSPDKISLIQSAALLNAAITRQPDEEKHAEDLNDLCKHVLECADAKLKHADLVGIAKIVEKKVAEMRSSVNRELSQIAQSSDDKQISAEKAYVDLVHSLQLHLSEDYKTIMAFVSQQCIDIMGPSPCRYTLVGMGSLARDEITPYSDFEHIIILENNSATLRSGAYFTTLEYFRWYSVIFHFIILNLQESIIPSVCIPCLMKEHTSGESWFKDYITTRGISFDGMMPHACKFPLGRTQKTENKPWTTELIKPVNEMVRYLETEQDLKNGYKLADILTKTCFVEGDQDLYEQFSEKVKTVLMQNASKPHLFDMQLKEDLANFDIIKKLTNDIKGRINIKRIIYRSITLFVSALGQLHNVKENSCLNIVEELKRMGSLSDYTAHRLSYAVAVACHVRLAHYMTKERQDDEIYNEDAASNEEKLKPLTRILSSRCLTKCFVSAFFLQLMLTQNTDIAKYEQELHEIEVWCPVRFLSLLGLHNEAIHEGEGCLAHRTKFDKKDVGVLFYLVKAYYDAGQSEKALQILLNAKELASLVSLSFLDPHYVYVTRMSAMIGIPIKHLLIMVCMALVIYVIHLISVALF